MQFIRHSFYHVLIHLALFSGFAILIPVITKAFETQAKPWAVSPSIFGAGMMLVAVSAVMLYRMKEDIPHVLQSMGATIFLPGAISLLSGILSFKDLLTDSSISGLAVVKPVAEFYIEHSVPTVLSVAAVYLFIGGMLYWLGHKFQQARDKFSFQN